MPSVTYAGATYPVASGETVLDALLRHGHPIANLCRGGACHSCLLRADGPIPAEAQRGLTATLVEQGYFLACSCVPERDLRILEAPR
jgi:CDP-4-dehydro-6-deoxyglucose reductase